MTSMTKKAARDILQRQKERDMLDRIVASEAFRAINLLIDQKANDLAQWIKGARGQIEDRFKSPSGINVRVSYEPGGRRDHPLAADAPQLVENLKFYSEKIASLHQEIGDLQRFKLQLLNDYDFTHGDDSQQKAVFG